MSGEIVQLSEEVIKDQVEELLQSSVVGTLNERLQAEAGKLT